jgi:hypothetical protein
MPRATNNQGFHGGRSAFAARRRCSWLSISVFRAMLPGARQDRLPRSLVGFIGL